MVSKTTSKKATTKSPRTRTVDKSAVTGKFVSEQDIKSHPKTTYRQTVRIPPRKKG